MVEEKTRKGIMFEVSRRSRTGCPHPGSSGAFSSSRQELQLTDNGFQHQMREQSPIHGRKKKEGAKGNVSPKSPEVGCLFFLSDFLLIEPCDVLLETSKIT